MNEKRVCKRLIGILVLGLNAAPIKKKLRNDPRGLKMVTKTVKTVPGKAFKFIPGMPPKDGRLRQSGEKVANDQHMHAALVALGAIVAPYGQPPGSASAGADVAPPPGSAGAGGSVAPPPGSAGVGGGVKSAAATRVRSLAPMTTVADALTPPEQVEKEIRDRCPANGRGRIGGKHGKGFPRRLKAGGDFHNDKD